ncbi:hypothetical protein [Methanohalophilus halophilus]|uniref:EF-hand domain-containing protein n=1 Tax=Methanohalophilus halophilus TaxID=2177 RepID=A0A1L3Q2R8_9EURY|nr:hypothetical protein [Methanohalophilus halophilus]APH39091.1 hypothetical protein BHR79_06060 [Methanohalophilus halophilus]RNI09853.1 hypothetical protein EFE40_04195 [Methanohalophilus halophilus]SDW93218.1 hypothetical protein SAMN04515625_1923 [Methanohalophilus halophilus]
MQWKISVFLLVAMLCLAFTGAAAAEDNVKCCWEKPCGTEVEQCDQETTFVLNEPDTENVNIIVNGGQWYYVDMNDDGLVSSGDVRLTGWHDEYGPNTKVLPGDDDNLLGADELDEQDIITYWDINDNGMYDLYDPAYVDVDNDGLVSVGDIRLTDVPPVDVYSLENADLGELVMEAGSVNDANNQRWSVVTSANDAGQQDKGMTLAHIGSGYLEDLVGYVDVDASGDWTCPDKLYINQPGDCWFDETVTIGDIRLYIPAYDEHSPSYNPDECIPECGTKVVQGEHDTTYALKVNIGADLAADPDYAMNQIYVDMDDNGKVSFGDIRLSNISTTYPPNTKVGPSNQADLDNGLEDLSSQDISYTDIDGLPGYSLGDPLYLDLDGSNDVTAGDLRLSDVPVFEQDGYMPGEIGEAYTLVEAGALSGDEDVGTALAVAGSFDDMAGYVDSDCTGTWTCPDKLYLQQLFDERGDLCNVEDVDYSPEEYYDWFVTAGDDRLYVPVNDPLSPFNGTEEWPECGTKVTLCNVDIEYALKNIMIDVGFIDRDKDGEFDQTTPEMSDAAYLDMDRNGHVSVGDIRLNNFTISGELFEANTKVAEHDEDLRFEKPLKPQGNDQLDDQNDPNYVGDTLTVDYMGTTLVFNTTDQHVGWFDTDCSGSWTCVDALYLQDLVEIPGGYDVSAGIDGDSEDLAVTHMDFRLYIPPDMICEEDNGDTGNGDTPQYNQFDANEDGVISGTELSNAIDAYYDGAINGSELSEIIDYYYLGGAGYL